MVQLGVVVLTATSRRVCSGNRREISTEKRSTHRYGVVALRVREVGRKGKAINPTG